MSNRRFNPSGYVVRYVEAKYAAGFGLVGAVDEFDCNKLPAGDVTGGSAIDFVVENSDVDLPATKVMWKEMPTVGDNEEKAVMEPVAVEELEGQFNCFWQENPIGKLMGTAVGQKPQHSETIHSNDGTQRLESYGVHPIKFSMKVDDPKNFVVFTETTKAYKTISNPNAVNKIAWKVRTTYPFVKQSDVVLTIDATVHKQKSLSLDIENEYTEKLATELNHASLELKNRKIQITFETEFPINAIDLEDYSETAKVKQDISIAIGSVAVYQGTLLLTNCYLIRETPHKVLKASPDQNVYTYRVKLSDTTVASWTPFA